MSLVFSTVDVAAGPTIGLKEQVMLNVLPLTEPKNLNETKPFSFVADQEKDSLSSDTSSIGANSSTESSEDDDQNEAESKPKDGALSSFGSLEESLPIKRGLSSHFTGKAKSFVDLANCANADAGDLAKPENPFNKRRRILMASKSSWSRRASCSSLTLSLAPLLSPDQTLEEGDEEDEDEAKDRVSLAPLPPRSGTMMKKSPFRSFSLSDLRRV